MRNATIPFIIHHYSTGFQQVLSKKESYSPISGSTSLNKVKQAFKKKNKLTAAFLRAFKMLICNMSIKRATQDISFNNRTLSAAGKSLGETLLPRLSAKPDAWSNVIGIAYQNVQNVDYKKYKHCRLPECAKNPGLLNVQYSQWLKIQNAVHVDFLKTFIVVRTLTTSLTLSTNV